MKRILLCAALCLVNVWAWGQSVIESGTCGAEGDNLTWELTDDGTLTISGTGEMVDYPNSYDYPWGFDDIQVVVIEEGVTSIGERAFLDCNSLTAVTIPGSVTSMGEYAFSRTGLTSVTIQEGVASIGESAFYGCTGLTSVTIPGSVTSIGNFAFNSCTGLTSVSIQEGVTSIGNSAFSVCTGLTSVTIPGSVTSIGNSAFE